MRYAPSLLLVGLVFSCGGSENEFAGEWSECNGGTQTDLDISDGQIVRTVTSYSSYGCTGDKRDVIAYNLETVLGSEIETQIDDRVFEIDFTYESVRYTPYRPEVVAELNDLGLAGGNWTLGISKVVTGLDFMSRTFPEKGLISLGLIGLEGNTGKHLIMTQGLVGSARNSNLNSATQYQKQ